MFGPLQGYGSQSKKYDKTPSNCHTLDYDTRTIITHSFYIFYPNFESQKLFFKEVFTETFAFMYG